MKFTFSFCFLFLMTWNVNSNNTFTEITQLKKCPSSPNCVSTQATRKRKRMKPLSFTHSVTAANVKLKNQMLLYPNATLISENGNYLHYEFKTKVGKFIDDVEFLFDEKTKQLHFRSASRKGWSDMGANKRRMKKVRKHWRNYNVIKSPKF